MQTESNEKSALDKKKETQRASTYRPTHVCLIEFDTNCSWIRVGMGNQ